MKPFVIGLVGCGLWGRNILRELILLGAKVLVVDPDPKSREFAKQNGAKDTFETMDTLLQVDGFILSTPASMHARQIEDLLRFNKPVFTEKPFVLNLEDALRLESLGAGRVFVMHVWRYHPAVQAMKMMIAEKRLGDLEMIRTRRCNWTSPRKDVDPIWTLLPHDISIFTELTGQVPTAGYATAELCNGKPIGMLAVTQSGCPCIAEVSSRYPEKIREIRVHGSEGVAVLTGDGAIVKVSMGNSDSGEVEQSEIPVSGESALRLEIKRFLDYLNGGPPPDTSLAQAVEITRCMTGLREMAGI